VNFDSFTVDFARRTSRLGEPLESMNFAALTPSWSLAHGTGQAKTCYSAFSVTHRDTAVTHLRGANLTDSATSQFRTPEITTVFPAINPR
jgi:hypothetical protein